MRWLAGKNVIDVTYMNTPGWVQDKAYCSSPSILDESEPFGTRNYQQPGLATTDPWGIVGLPPLLPPHFKNCKPRLPRCLATKE